MNTSERFTCPCCGYLSFSGWPGSYDVCHVCYWEDDSIQMLNPEYRGGANTPSLFEAQANYRRYGAVDEEFVKNVQGIGAGDRQDPGWRPLDELDRGFHRTPVDLSQEKYDDLNVWYYWRRRRA